MITTLVRSREYMNAQYYLAVFGCVTFYHVFGAN